MNICFFLNSGGWGGAENVVYNLAKSIEREGHNVSVILNEETYPYFKDLKNVKLYNIGPLFDYENFLRANFDVSIPPVFSKYGFVSKVLRFFLGPPLRHLNYIKISNKVLKIIEEINPDIIHFHNPVVLDFYSYIHKCLGYPLIYTSHGRDFKKRGNPLDKITDIKTRGLLASFDQITTVSEYMKEYLVSNGISSNIKVIYNGVDLNYIDSLRNEFDTNNEKYDNQLNKEQFILLFSGGIKTNKGGLILLKAMEILNSKNLAIKLYYAGTTTKAFVEKNKIDKVTFTGLLQHEAYLNKLNSCDCLISLSKTEGFGISILEAMALGTPVITTPVGGIPEFFLNERNGLYVTSSPNDIAEKILYLYKNRELKEEISKNNLNDAKKFDWNNIIVQYVDIYEAILNSEDYN